MEKRSAIVRIDIAETKLAMRESISRPFPGLNCFLKVKFQRAVGLTILCFSRLFLTRLGIRIKSFGLTGQDALPLHEISKAKKERGRKKSSVLVELRAPNPSIEWRVQCHLAENMGDREQIS